ncbi:glutathione S-transferase kappa 1-like isoform X1 [Orbicella faveolata]|uniref:glutathione S-transferase kappa 1-like isoform X1 n=1 Tax=Orbicella faveolata TaxID=48498 RepID=UPI0009E4A5BA|nr:glutathione S-transferase kappa 1-like isoform X1 [Orbicella faveolata]
MAVAKRTVELFYDVLSPYSWVAFEVLCRYQTKWNLDLQFRPFFLSGIMAGSGNKPPGTVPAKAAYMSKDIERLRDFYGIPLVPPADPADVMFRKGSLSAMRLVTAATKYYPDKVEPLSREFWMRIWSRDEDITEPQSLLEVCQNIGLTEHQTQSLVSKIGDQEIKDKLKETTQKALDMGAFGAPIIVAHVNGKPHMYFGSDRFLLLANLLGVEWEGPLVPRNSNL